jgi:hypothetical protein
LQNGSKRYITEEIWQILKDKGTTNFNTMDTLYSFLKNLRNEGLIKGERKGISYLYDEKDLEIIVDEMNQLNDFLANGLSTEKLYKHFIRKKLIDLAERTFRSFLRELRESGNINYKKIGTSYFYESSTIIILEKLLQNKLEFPAPSGLISLKGMWLDATEANLTTMDLEEFYKLVKKMRTSKKIWGKRYKGNYFFTMDEYEEVKKSLKPLDMEFFYGSVELREKLKNKGMELDIDQFSKLLAYLKTNNNKFKLVNINYSLFLPKNQFENMVKYIKKNNLHLSENYIKSHYVDTVEASKMLNLVEGSVRSYCNKGFFEGSLKYKDKWMIPKNTLQNYKENKPDFSNCITPSELGSQIGHSKQYILIRVHNGEIKAIWKDKKCYIPLDEAENYLKKYNEMVAEYTKLSALNDLKEYLDDLKSTLPEESHNLFKNWSTQKISDSGARALTLKTYYRNCRRLYEYLLTKCNNEELFNFDDKKLESIVKDQNLSKPLKKEFIHLNKYVLAKKGIVKSSTLILDERGKEKKDKEKEIYIPEIYDEYYRYVQKVDIHIKNAIEDQYYSNMWVYVIMHLTNIWRGNDIIMEMPEVAIEVIDVTSFDYFIENTLSVTQIQIIINDMYQNLEGSLANKNKKELRFYVDPTLENCFATALVIAEIHRRKYKGKQKHKSLLLATLVTGLKGQFLLTSGNKHHLKFFGEQKHLMNFKSLMMNRSTALYLFHHILEEDGKDSDQALDMVKNARSHKKSETTAIYVESKNKDGSINRVSLNLFRRGHFGWLYNAIVKMASQDYKNHNLEERTQLISENRQTQSPLQVEKWSAFLLEHSRNMNESIIQKLMRMSKNELLYLLYKIFRGEMPSKEREGQCFTYPECQFKARKTCFGCSNFIPQQMILVEVANELRNRVKKLKDSHMFEAIQVRESIYINNLLSIISEARKELGKAKVRSFITGTEITQLMSSVGSMYLTPKEIELWVKNHKENKTLIDRK